jgi:acyl-CoA thioesterase-1
MKTSTKRALLTLTVVVVVIAVAVVVVVTSGVLPRRAPESAGRAPESAGRVTGGRVAAVGDSITFGEGVDPDRREEESYPGQLQGLLGSDYQVLNFGYIGATVQDGGDTPYKETDAYAASLRSDPAVVIVMLGANDSKPQNWNAGTYESQLKELIALYRLLPTQPAVYVATPPVAFENAAKIQPKVIAEEIVPIVREVGERTGTPVINVYSATRDHREYFPDGVHPNREGASIIAATVNDALKP